jgi:hypothetical protein
MDRTPMDLTLMDDFDPRLGGGSIYDSDPDEQGEHHVHDAHDVHDGPDVLKRGAGAPATTALAVDQNPALMAAYRADRRAKFDATGSVPGVEPLDQLLGRLRAGMRDLQVAQVAQITQVAHAKRTVDELDAELDQIALSKLDAEQESGPGSSALAREFGAGDAVAAYFAMGYEEEPGDGSGRPLENPATDLAIHNAQVDGGLAADPERPGASPSDMTADGAIRAFGSDVSAEHQPGAERQFTDPKIGWRAELNACENELGRLLSRIDALTLMLGSA